ncbi:hypothetical protein EIP91_010949 [Steccherinum ochraceum]|uniref:Cytochrome P450-dit2 n=1 Tax=Steccherinum ochraceum TaxID=92696 RepID=A0A4R0R026_9APHY|nr:hypothetical protein EIP91_010949 [Steccherinum ochraceum]
MFTVFTSSLALLLLLPIIVIIYVAHTFLRLLIRQRLSPLRTLPGPPSPSIFLGNLREMHDQENNGLVQRWSDLYGSTFVYRGFLNGCRLMTTDPVAASYVLGRAYDFPKPDFVRDGLSSMIGGHEGILVVEGEDHRRQRKVLTPAFTAAHIRTLSPVFWQKAAELRSIWLNLISSSDSGTPVTTPPDPLTPTKTTGSSPPSVYHATGGHSSSFLPNPFSSFVSSKIPPTVSAQDGARIRKTGGARQKDVEKDVSVLTSSSVKAPGPRVDVLAWFARATLDVIGEAGFGYTFDSLSGGKESELAHAFGVIFSTARKFRVITILQVWFPVLRKFQSQPTELREAHATMHRIGLELIEQKRAEVLAEKAAAAGSVFVVGVGLMRMVLYGTVVRSNMSEDPAQRMSTNETLCQISTFIAAGHETTASALTWSLYALASAPAVQNKLRASLQGVRAPSFHSSESHHTPLCAVDDLSEILTHPYLDAVVREALRLHAPVTSTMRVAAHDDVIPLSSSSSSSSESVAGPGSIRVNKGDIISIPISTLNQSTEEWGEDGRVFRPERWLDDDVGEVDGNDEGKGSAGGSGSGRRGLREKRGARVQGLWGNMLTFLNGNPVNGNRACIGWRFAVNEIKIFLYVLVRDIEFSIDPALVVEKKVKCVVSPLPTIPYPIFHPLRFTDNVRTVSSVVTRPWIKSEPHLGNQMPLYIRHVSSDSDSEE